MNKLESLIKTGIRAIGLNGINKMLQGRKLHRSEAIKAKCYDCCAGYADGVEDCGITDCPLYEYHPYKGKVS